MSKKKQSITARLRKHSVALIVLLLFLFPAIQSGVWLRNIVVGNDPRKVYKTDEIADFKDPDCVVNTENIRPFEEPLITITLDDGWETVYSGGFRVLEANCVKSTVYILGDHFPDVNYLSKDQVHSLQKSGHEIASHAMTHPNLTTLAPEQLAWELGHSDKLLTDEFGEMKEFASPLGANNPTVLNEIKKYYRSHRNTVADPKTVGDEDINVKSTFDPYQINAYTVRNTTTPEEIQKLIDHTIKRKGWLVLTYHQMDDQGGLYAVTPSILDQHLELIRKSKVRTSTMGYVLDMIESRRAQ
jgi:peptidoglycan/xylan/chitin deacetylase (PgdA/CDA1 family)